MPVKIHLGNTPNMAHIQKIKYASLTYISENISKIHLIPSE